MDSCHLETFQNLQIAVILKPTGADSCSVCRRRLKGEREAGNKGTREVGNVNIDTEVTIQFGADEHTEGEGWDDLVHSLSAALKGGVSISVFASKITL